MVRLGQNFLADPNLLDAIVRDAELAPADVVLEVGAGEGVLTERLALVAAHVHAIEIDRGLETALAPLAARDNVTLHWADAMRIDLGGARAGADGDGRQPALLGGDAAAAAHDRASCPRCEAGR